MMELKDKNFVGKSHSGKSLNKEILEALPLNIREIIHCLPPKEIADIEEIRLRANKPLIIYSKNRDLFISSKGQIVSDKNQAYMISKLDIERAYQLITNYSIYALEEDIRNGFITIIGGHRVGICGRAVLHEGRIKTLKDVSGLNIRISKEKLGTSDLYMKYLIDSPHDCFNTLIISPPQCGKTTLLRDIIRNLSNGMENPKFVGFKIGVVDERSEICGSYQGVAQNDIGIRTDVLDACPKADGIMMLIRSMSPQVIATDEIGRKEDIMAIEEALNAGIRLITTVHGRDLEDISRRPYLKELLIQGVFHRIIVLSNHPKVGTVSSIIDGKNNHAILSCPAGKERSQFVS